jgi:hypothetical protein
MSKNKKQYICTICGHVGLSKKKVPGSLIIEVMLWLAFLLPGVIYSIWRMASAKEVCESCGNATLIPTDTPKGQELLNQQRPQQI